MVETTSPIWSRSEKESNKIERINSRNRKFKSDGEGEKQRGRKRTENSGFAGIVEAENEDSSFLVTEKRGKQFGEHYSHLPIRQSDARSAIAISA